MIKTIAILLISVTTYAQKDTVKVIMLLSQSTSTYTSYGWDVRELKNTIEKDSSTVLCCTDYWQHIEYLNENRKPICGTKKGCGVIVWASVDSNWIRVNPITFK